MVIKYLNFGSFIQNALLYPRSYKTLIGSKWVTFDRTGWTQYNLPKRIPGYKHNNSEVVSELKYSSVIPIERRNRFTWIQKKI